MHGPLMLQGGRSRALKDHHDGGPVRSGGESRNLCRPVLSQARYHPLTNSWNHSKIVAVDSLFAMVGGENLWTNDYLIKNPVNDLNIRVDGPAAKAANFYASRLWDYTCYWNADWYYKNWIHSRSWTLSNPGEIGSECRVYPPPLRRPTPVRQPRPRSWVSGD